VTTVDNHTDTSNDQAAANDGYTVTRDDGTSYRVLPSRAFGWVVCTGPNLDLAPTRDGGFAIGFPSAAEAIGAVLAEDTIDTAAAASTVAGPTAAAAPAVEDGDDATDGM
jgi:hypothetical protein